MNERLMQRIDVIKRMQQNEATESEVYRRLSKRMGGENGQILAKIAEDEKRHCQLLKEYTNEIPKPKMWKVRFYSLLGRVFGLTFVINLMEHGEEHAKSNYDELREVEPVIARIYADEQSHEMALLEMIDEEKLHYIGSMVLGLNDALVELTGALAGFTFALANTRTVFLAGLITGVAATLSMGASEYLSEKNRRNRENFKCPVKSAIYTGMAYMITVVLLLLPYLLFESPALALGVCLLNAAIIILVFTYFVSVVRGKPFKPAFLEMITISFGVAFISFLIGLAARNWLGLDM